MNKSVKVLFFASLADQLGVRELELELPAAARVSDALDRLTQTHPDLAAQRETLAVAVNLAYVDPAHVLADGDELALIPPVSGG